MQHLEISCAVRRFFKSLDIKGLISHLHLESFEIWCWRTIEKISLTDRAKNEEVVRGEFRPRPTRQLPRAVDLKGRFLSCQSY